MTDTFTLEVGRVVNHGDHVEGHYHLVQFDGKVEGSATRHDNGRGVDYTLYTDTTEGWVLYVRTWSNVVGEPTTKRLVVVEERDFRACGPYDDIGPDLGIGQTLSLDEALAYCEKQFPR